MFYNPALSPPSPPCLSFSILCGSVHFSHECLSSQTPLGSSLLLLNTNKICTTQVGQGARAQRDKRPTHCSVAMAVNLPLLTFLKLGVDGPGRAGGGLCSSPWPLALAEEHNSGSQSPTPAPMLRSGSTAFPQWPICLWE